MVNALIMILGFVLLIVGIFLFYAMRNSNGKSAKLVFGVIFIIAGIVVCISSSSFTIIETGFTGVLKTYKRVEETPLHEGLNKITPIIQSVTKVDNRKKDITFAEDEDKRIWGESRDQVQVYMENVIVTYNILPEGSVWLVTNVKSFNEDKVITYELLSSALKNGMVKLPADEVTQRSIIEPVVKETLQEAINDKYAENVIQISKVVVNQMDYEDSYNTALAKRNALALELEEKELQNEQDKKNAEAAKAVKEKEAEGDAAVKVKEAEANATAKIKAAEAEAQANKLLSDSIDDSIKWQQFINKWDGKFPLIVGENGEMMLDISSIIE